MDAHENLIVDGYNVINGWRCFKNIKDKTLEFLRSRLIDILDEYSSFTGITVTVVFDGKSGNRCDVFKSNKVKVIFTKSNESADSVIERMVYKSENRKDILVATSDSAQKLFVIGTGAKHISPKELEKMVFSKIDEMRKDYLRK